MDRALNLLKEEEAVLSKLLIRNSKQHGKTRIFGYLKRVQKNIQNYLKTEDLRSLLSDGEKALKSKPKVSLTES